MNSRPCKYLLSFLFLAISTLSAELPPESNTLKVAHLPTPFTAGEIMKSCSPGHTLTFLVEAEDEAPAHHISKFIDGGDNRANYIFSQTDIEGALIETPKTLSDEWMALQAHASFPKSETKLTEEIITVSAGEYDCWLYTQILPINHPETGVASSRVLKFWFAKKLPGPPVKFTMDNGGKQVFSMILLSVEDE